MDRPQDLFDREREWDDLDLFMTARGRGLDLGIVSGRRRQGKSFLLRRLSRAVGGLYSMALEEARGPALERFGRDAAEALGVGPASLRFADWGEALRIAIGSGGDGPGRLVVLDELPYLLRHSPEIPSVLQQIYDERTDVGPRSRMILCGSAMSVMSQLLSGTKALRGRARLDMLVRPFDYRQASGFWRVGDPKLAFRLHAIFGGTPGYLDLVGDPPDGLGDLGPWLATNVLNPSHALFGETAYLLREDPRVTDRATYYSVLGAVAAGASTLRRIASRIGRDERSLAHALDVLLSSGFLERDDDVLLQRRPHLRTADPIVRFSLLVIAPRLASFEEREAERGWEAAAPTFESQVLGPHFEHLARVWTGRFAARGTWGEEVGEVGTTVVNDTGGRAQHQVDVVALGAGNRRQDRSSRIIVLGEAKLGARRSVDDVNRLERIRALLVGRGVDAGGARLALFAGQFTPDLRALARSRDDVVLIDLERLYAGD